MYIAVGRRFYPCGKENGAPWTFQEWGIFIIPPQLGGRSGQSEKRKEGPHSGLPHVSPTPVVEMCQGRAVEHRVSCQPWSPGLCLCQQLSVHMLPLPDVCPLTCLIHQMLQRESAFSDCRKEDELPLHGSK